MNEKRVREIMREELRLNDLKKDLAKEQTKYWKDISKGVEMDVQFGHNAGDVCRFTAKHCQERIEEMQKEIKELDKLD